MSEHTPSPWLIVREELDDSFSDEEQAMAFPCSIGPIADWTPVDDSLGTERVEADARLISAAPDMLAALECVYACELAWDDAKAAEAILRRHGWSDDVNAKDFVCELRRLAIAKARGLK